MKRCYFFGPVQQCDFDKKGLFSLAYTQAFFFFIKVTLLNRTKQIAVLPHQGFNLIFSASYKRLLLCFCIFHRNHTIPKQTHMGSGLSCGGCLSIFKLHVSTLMSHAKRNLVEWLKVPSQVVHTSPTCVIRDFQHFCSSRSSCNRAGAAWAKTEFGLRPRFLSESVYKISTIPPSNLSPTSVSQTNVNFCVKTEKKLSDSQTKLG